MNLPAAGKPGSLLRFGVPSVEAAREQGYTCLSPEEQQFAYDFVVRGDSLKDLAAAKGIPVRDAKVMFNDPIIRALISDLQTELLQHRVINELWVEQQLLDNWPKLTGEEPVPMVDKNGEAYRARKYHSAEVVSILKHFSGGKDQKAAGGVNVQINFNDLLSNKPSVVIEGTLAGEEE